MKISDVRTRSLGIYMCVYIYIYVVVSVALLRLMGDVLVSCHFHRDSGAPDKCHVWRVSVRICWNNACFTLIEWDLRALPPTLNLDEAGIENGRMDARHLFMYYNDFFYCFLSSIDYTSQTCTLTRTLASPKQQNHLVTCHKEFNSKKGQCIAKPVKVEPIFGRFYKPFIETKNLEYFT